MPTFILVVLTIHSYCYSPDEYFKQYFDRQRDFRNCIPGNVNRFPASSGAMRDTYFFPHKRTYLTNEGGPDMYGVKAPVGFLGTTRGRLSLILIVIASLTLLWGAQINFFIQSTNSGPSNFKYPFPSARSTTFSGSLNAEAARSSFESWVAHLQQVAKAETGSENVTTERIGCREYEAGSQSCVFEGISCVDVRTPETNAVAPLRGRVYIVDDSAPNGSEVPSDSWCQYRHQSASPRYFGPRHWPILKGTVAPQWSCLDGRFVSHKGLLEMLSNGNSSIKWLENAALVDLDYKSNTHNSTSYIFSPLCRVYFHDIGSKVCF